MRKFLFRALVVLAWLGASAAEADACSCMISGPPCQAAWSADAIFSGRVRSIERIDQGPVLGPVLVTFDVDRFFLGEAVNRVELVTGSGGGDCGYRFVQGRQYLVYAFKNGASRLTAGICSRTRPLEEAREDLEYLTKIHQQAPGGRVYGRITHWQRDPFEARAIDYGPLQNVAVNVHGPALSRDVFTDEHGRFEVSGLPPGRLAIALTAPPGYDSRYLERAFELKDPRACAVHDFRLTLVARAAGALVDAQGRPLAGVPVDAVAAELAGHQPPPYQRPATTDAAGRFEFDDLPPGAYVFGLNLTEGSRRRVAGAPLFFPGTSDPAAAAVITLKPGDRLHIGELHVVDAGGR